MEYFVNQFNNISKSVRCVQKHQYWLYGREAQHVSILAVKRTPDDPNFVRQVEIECTFN